MSVATLLPAPSEQAATYFEQLPSQHVDQSWPSYYPQAPCCIGAHLAHIYGVTRGRKRDFLRGADAWARAVGGNRAHAILLLRNAGAAHDPFGPAQWPTPPHIVFRRVAAIEALPLTDSADLSNCRLQHAYLAGTDFRNADFSGGTLQAADLTGTNLAGARLRGTILDDAKLIAATLDGADLEGAWLPRANLTGAKLTGVTLQRSILEAATLIRADLTAAVLRDAVLRDANLNRANLTGADFTGAETERLVAITDSVPAAIGLPRTGDVRTATDGLKDG